MNKMLSCHYNMDTNRVEAQFADNSHIMLLPFLLHLLGFLYILVSMDLFFYYIQYQPT